MVKLVIGLIVLVLAMSYFGISLQHIVESPAGSANLHYVTGLISNGFELVVAWITGFAGAIVSKF